MNVRHWVLFLMVLVASFSCATRPASLGTGGGATASGGEGSHQPGNLAGPAQPEMVESPVCSPPLSISEPVHGHCKPIRFEFEVQADAEGTPVSVRFLSVKPYSPHSERLGTFLAECFMAARFEPGANPRTFQFGIDFDDSYGPRCAH